MLVRRPSRRPSPLRPVETFGGSPKLEDGPSSVGLYPAVSTFPGVRQGSVGSVMGQELAEELKELSTLHHEGELSPSEFTAAKHAVIGMTEPEPFETKRPPTTSSSPLRSKPFTVPVPTEVEMLAQENSALKSANEDLRYQLSRKPNLTRVMEELQAERDTTENLREMLKKSSQQASMSSPVHGELERLRIVHDKDQEKVDRLESRLKSEEAALEMLRAIHSDTATGAVESNKSLKDEVLRLRTRLHDEQSENANLKSSIREDEGVDHVARLKNEVKYLKKEADRDAETIQELKEKIGDSDADNKRDKAAAQRATLEIEISELKKKSEIFESAAEEDAKTIRELKKQITDAKSSPARRSPVADISLVEKENEILARERDRAQKEKNVLAAKLQKYEKSGEKPNDSSNDDGGEAKIQLLTARREVAALKSQLQELQMQKTPLTVDVMSNSNPGTASAPTGSPRSVYSTDSEPEDNRLTLLENENKKLTVKNKELEEKMKSDLKIFRDDLEEVKRTSTQDDTSADDLKEQIIDMEEQIVAYNKTRRKIAVVLSAGANWRIANSKYRAWRLFTLQQQQQQQLQQQQQPGSPRRTQLGITAEESDNTDGVRLAAVHPNGKAEQAGLLPGDVIIEVNGQIISTSDDLVQAASHLKYEQETEVKYARHASVRTAVLGARRDQGDGVVGGGDDLSYPDLMRNLMSSERRRCELENIVQEIGDIDEKLTLAGVAAQVKTTHELYMGAQERGDSMKVSELTIVIPNLPSKRYHKILYVSESDCDACVGDILLRVDHEYITTIMDLACCSSGGKHTFTICRPARNPSEPPLLLALDLAFASLDEDKNSGGGAGYDDTHDDDATPPPTAPPPTTARASVDRSGQNPTLRRGSVDPDHDVAWL
eukprot:TRINITY_DN12637_c2_g1_i1.p1 TRINITY_DN12637_c2_g1~~TRINITY_DN12637_c2_g1_i1.p1  ORF type:complete len:891 (+),score=225.27 TRINITY_DN12637_c2_g1_i1:61-2733(+)